MCSSSIVPLVTEVTEEVVVAETVVVAVPVAVIVVVEF